ncbi:MAG: penicillin-binding transpeptidase domain-containing protein [Clostridia bacterium]
MKYLKKMGITTLSKEDENLALALGGLDKGISPLQMAAAYATIANDGIYIEPTFYTKVVNSNSQTVIQQKQKTKKVFSKEVAYIVKELLTEPVKGSNGTATYCAISGMDVAAKTGTTDDNYDRWLCGFTPYYTGVTWYGYDQNETINYNGKKNPAGILWANIMPKIHTNLTKATFTKPASVFTATICSETGMRANSGCPHTYTEYFLWGTLPNDCTQHTGGQITEKNTTKNNTTKYTNTSSSDSFDTTTKEDLDSTPTTENKITTNTKQNKTTENTNTSTNINSTVTTNKNNATSNSTQAQNTSSSTSTNSANSNTNTEHSNISTNTRKNTVNEPNTNN